MASQQEANKNNPEQPVWAWNEDTMQFAERAYRTWLQGAETIQTKALDYWSTEVQKGIEAMNAMAKCQTAVEALNVQTRYATEAMQGLIAESQKVMDQLATFTNTPWAATTIVPRPQSGTSNGNGHDSEKSRLPRRK